MKVEVNGLSKKYFSGTDVLHDLSFVADGGVFVICGGRWSGKTTLLKVIAGLENYQSGEVKLNGVNIREIPEKHRDLAVYLENKPFFGRKTALKNIVYPLKIRGVGKERYQMGMNAAERVGLGIGLLDKPAYMLTPEQSALTQIARMITVKRGLYLFDNPLRAFSGDERESAFETLRGLFDELDGTVIYATDSTREAELLGGADLSLKYGYSADKYPTLEDEIAAVDAEFKNNTKHVF